MNSHDKIKSSHLNRDVYIYIRQSSQTQVLCNRESTDRQYRLVDRALQLGWKRQQVQIIDDDQACSGADSTERDGFNRLISNVALGLIGLVLSLEVSRVARNNADWYRLLELCKVTDCLIGDEEGLYHPSIFNDRLVLGMKGTMAEAELHILRSRLDGGIRNKAARGELRRGLPVGLVWGEEDGGILFHPSEDVVTAIGHVFEQFAAQGSARRVWLWFQDNELLFPFQGPYRKQGLSEIKWITATYTTIHRILSNPAYAGAYAYGKTRSERYVDDEGHFRKRIVHLPRSEWQVLITEHHQGYIDWETYERNLTRMSQNTRPQSHESSGAVREGSALLQGLATCGNCGRHLRVYYRGNNSMPGYYCASNHVVNGRGERCLQIGGSSLDRAVAEAFLQAISPAALDAVLQAQANFGSQRDAKLTQLKMAVERARFQADRTERRYLAVDPDNRLVAGGLETEWEKGLQELAAAKEELTRQEALCPKALTSDEQKLIRYLASDIARIWDAETTTDRDRKELLRTLLEEVNISVQHEDRNACLVLRWKGGLFTDLEVNLRQKQPALRTDEETVDLVRRLAQHYPDATIAGILNRQERTTATGKRFLAAHVGNLRRYWKIPRYIADASPDEGDLVTIAQAAKILDVAPSTLHRQLNDGFIAGEQLTPGAPWRIRMNDELRAIFVADAPEGYVTMKQAIKRLGVSRQTVLQRVKDGKLEAVHVRKGRHKGIRIRLLDEQPCLFEDFHE